MSLKRTLAVAALLAFAPPAHPQGCTQCRDNTQATPPSTQAAYRHAILFLSGAAGTLFLATIVMLKRQR